jgi:hypothetical protein
MSYWDGTQWVADAPGRGARDRHPIVQHVLAAVAEGGMIALLTIGLVAGTAFAASQTGTISVTFNGAGLGPSSNTGSVFTARGCGFRANNTDYAMVVYGPAPQTSSYGYWVDYFPVDAAGCGSSTVSWTSSGVAGTFKVWVARSPSGHFYSAQPASNVVSVTITDP